MVDQALGYLSFEYADSLSEFGVPLYLPRCKGWILQRPIAGTPHWDGVGLYPLFCCENHDYLAEDLRELKKLVSIVVVMGPPPAESAYDAFDRYRKFKTFYVIDQDREYKPSRHHLRYARKAVRDGVQVCKPGGSDMANALIDWGVLYSDLVSKHHITGIQAFSFKSFVKQFRVPGLNVFSATYEGKTVSMLLFYDQGDRVYYHLGASSELGYELKASFPLMDFAIKSFNGKTVILGGASGSEDLKDGLAQFKAGWANIACCSMLCETVNQPGIYDLLASGRTDYYPAYRGT